MPDDDPYAVIFGADARRDFARLRPRQSEQAFGGIDPGRLPEFASSASGSDR
jgi:hypothetical protein